MKYHAAKNQVESLLTDYQRRTCSVADHQRFRESISTDPQFDEIDQALADPIHDHMPQAAPKHKVRGILNILDQLDQQQSNRRFTP